MGRVVHSTVLAALSGRDTRRPLSASGPLLGHRRHWAESPACGLCRGPPSHERTGKAGCRSNLSSAPSSSSWRYAASPHGYGSGPYRWRRGLLASLWSDWFPGPRDCLTRCTRSAGRSPELGQARLQQLARASKPGGSYLRSSYIRVCAVIGSRRGASQSADRTTSSPCRGRGGPVEHNRDQSVGPAEAGRSVHAHQCDLPFKVAPPGRLQPLSTSSVSPAVMCPCTRHVSARSSCAFVSEECAHGFSSIVRPTPASRHDIPART